MSNKITLDEIKEVHETIHGVVNADLIGDTTKLQLAFDVIKWADNKVYNEDWGTLNKFIKFRLEQIDEEVFELREAIYRDKSAEDTVDALIDIIVFALGTLNLFAIDTSQAWEEVFKANMTKEVGIKPGRPNPFGLPDMIKPEGWVGPDHSDNLGFLEDTLKKGTK